MFETDKMILTGAGASIPLNIPGMQGMAIQFKKYIKKEQSFSKVYKQLIKHGASEDIEKILEFANEITEFTSRPISSFIESCVAPQQGDTLNKYKRRRDADIKAVRNFRNVLFSWISNTCLGFERNKAEIIYGELIETLTERQIPVYTTNYDAVLDYVATRRGISVADNFIKNSIGRLFWDKDLRAFNQEGLKLINIHGSIQWHGSDDGKIEKIPQPATVNREGQPLSQLMIFPTRFKDIYQQNYFPLYASFIRTLGRAKVLFVIGHSLRDEYLLAAIRERLRDEYFYLVVIDPDFPTEHEITDGPSDPRCKRVFHIKKTIESVYPILIQAIKEVTIKYFPNYMAELVQGIKRNKTDKLKISSTKLLSVLGKEIKINLEIETYIGNGIIKVWLEINKDSNSRENLSFDMIPDRTNLKGYVKETTILTMKIPNTVELGNHNLCIGLEAHDGQFVATDSRPIKIK
jgi:hypothetical protein